MRLERGFHRPPRRRSICEQQKRLTTLIDRFSSGSINVTTFLRSVGYAFSRLGDQPGEEAIQVSATTNERLSVDNDDTGNGAPVDQLSVDQSPMDQSTVDQPPQSSVANTTPIRRRQLRNLASRRSRPTATTATASAATMTATPAALAAAETTATPPVATAAASATATIETVAMLPEPTPLDCPVCYFAKFNTVIIPCGHCTCAECFQKIMQSNVVHGQYRRCPICRGDILGYHKLHF